MTRQAGKLIIPFSEGEGEETALPVLIRRLIRSDPQANQDIYVDNKAWRVGHLEKLQKNDGAFWKAQLTKASLKGAAAVLLLLDGDRPSNLGKPPLCIGTVAGQLSSYARQAGAGETFSVAIVIARQEMESWFIAGAASLCGRGDKDGPLLSDGSKPPDGDLELSPRDAKGWLSDHMTRGYKPTLDQARLAHVVDFEQIRQRKIRSFRRLEHATADLCDAIMTGRPICTPVGSPVGGRSRG